MVEFILCLNVTRKNTLLFTVIFKSKFDLVNKKKNDSWRVSTCLGHFSERS